MQLSLVQVHLLVASGAEGDQILLRIVSQLAARIDVVNLELGKTPTVLAAPAITLQHPKVELLVSLRLEPPPRPSGPGPPWVEPQGGARPGRMVWAPLRV